MIQSTNKQVWLEPYELEEIIVGVFGDRKWKSGLSKIIGMSPSNIHRYITGEVSPIPQYVALIARFIQGYRAAGLQLPADFFCEVLVKPYTPIPKDDQ